MALTVEDGSIVDGADSFVTLADFVAFAAGRGVVIEDEEAAEVHLRKAAFFLVTKEGCFDGRRVSPDQTLPYPRAGAVLYGFEIASTAIPDIVKQAQMEYALAAVGGVELFPNETGAFVRREKVGPLETEYWGQDGPNARVIVPAADALIDVLCGNAGFLTLVRA